MAASSENACVVARVESRVERRWPLGWVLRWLSSRVSVDPEWVEEMRQLSRRGTVVHVLLRLSLVEFLVLDQICRTYDLPPIRMVTGAGRYALWPLRWLLGVLWHRCSSCDTEAVASVAQRGESSLLFLRPASWFSQRRSSSNVIEATETLVRLQRSLDRPVFLVPHLLLWGRRRHGSSRGAFWTWWLQQLREGPGLLRFLGRVIRRAGTSQVRAGQPLELSALIEEVGSETSVEELAQQVRFTLRRRIEQVRKLVLGPMAKSAEVIRDEVLRNVVLNDHIREIAAAKGLNVEKLRKRARKLLFEIMAVPKSGYIAGLNLTLWWLWSRIFEGVELDREGLNRWREVAREGPLIIISSHKSHVDYLILSQIFWEEGIFPPHIAAGRNLSFWPIGAVFRGCGAFFIRRQFISDELYVAVLQAYITKILQEGYHLEFFIEGTRSRSGKLLPPKLGLLGMTVDAARRLKGYKVRIAPASVTYGRVPEEGSHTAELEGREKRAEDIGGLIRARKALRRRHGVIYVEFGEPIDIGDYLRDQGLAEVGSTDERRLRKVVTNLAYRTVHEINRVTVTTPTALVATTLLTNRRRGMTHSTLHDEVNRFARCLSLFGARFSASLKDAGRVGVPDHVLSKAVAFLSGADLVTVHDTGGEEPIYTVPDVKRLALDYYKNSTLHPLVNALMVGAALGTSVEEDGRTWDELADRVRFLSRLLKYEFIFRADAVFEVNLDATVSQLEGFGQVERRGWQVVAPTRSARRILRGYALMVENFIESYLIMVRQVRLLDDQKVQEKDLLKQALAQGERMYLTGEVELREARSKINLQNALRALVDLGVLERDEERALRVSERYRSPRRLPRLERRVASYLVR